MLGRTIADPSGIEGPPGTVAGLGLLDVHTVLNGEKQLAIARGTTSDGIAFDGFEMHMGVTEGGDRVRPFAQLESGVTEGAISPSGRVLGTYIHGLFAGDPQRAAWLGRLRAGPTMLVYDALVEETLDQLAAHLATHIDLDRLLNLSR